MIKYPKLLVDEYTSPIDSSVEHDKSINDCHTLIQQKGYRHLPVTKDNSVVGVISQRDINLFVNFNTESIVLNAEDIMHSDPYIVSYDTPIETVVFALSDKKIGSALIMDSSGKVSGIFTTTDAMNALIDLLHHKTNT